MVVAQFLNGYLPILLSKVCLLVNPTNKAPSMS